MLIPLLELILYWNKELQMLSPDRNIDYDDALLSTIAYLNLYHQTQEMLNKLGETSNKILLEMRLQG